MHALPQQTCGQGGKSIRSIRAGQNDILAQGQSNGASYANFYIANGTVIVPSFQDKKNRKTVMEILQREFFDRRVISRLICC